MWRRLCERWIVVCALVSARARARARVCVCKHVCVMHKNMHTVGCTAVSKCNNILDRGNGRGMFCIPPPPPPHDAASSLDRLDHQCNLSSRMSYDKYADLRKMENVVVQTQADCNMFPANRCVCCDSIDLRDKHSSSCWSGKPPVVLFFCWCHKPKTTPAANRVNTLLSTHAPTGFAVYLSRTGVLTSLATKHGWLLSNATASVVNSGWYCLCTNNIRNCGVHDRTFGYDFVSGVIQFACVER